jgi:AcrR family transcriptional regulator
MIKKRKGLVMPKIDPRAAREMRRRRENHETILHAAEAVLLRKGVSAMSMDDVGAEAGFSKATLYRYFKNKAELVFEILVHFIDDFEQRLNAVVARPAPVRDKLRLWVDASLRLLSEKENMTRIFLLDRSFMRLLQIFVGSADEPGMAAERSFLKRIRDKRSDMNGLARALLREGIEARVFRSLDMEGGVTFMEAVIEGYFVEKFWSDKPASIDRDIERLDDFLWHSLCLNDKVARREK